MPLIECGFCGEKVSTFAKACPHCGWDAKISNPDAQATQAAESQKRATGSSSEPRARRPWALWAAAATVVVAAAYLVTSGGFGGSGGSSDTGWPELTPWPGSLTGYAVALARFEGRDARASARAYAVAASGRVDDLGIFSDGGSSGDGLSPMTGLQDGSLLAYSGVFETYADAITHMRAIGDQGIDPPYVVQVEGGRVSIPGESDTERWVPLADLPDRFRVLSLEEVAPEYFDGLSAWDVTVIRNSLYARHGYRFEANELVRDFFERQPWYRVNPDYSLDLQSDIERRNLEVMLDL